MIRLDPMSEGEFRASLARAIPRHAAEEVRRGHWTEEEAAGSSQTDFSQLLPQGRETPNFHFCWIVDEESGTRVGETWYNMQTKGGKMQFWIDWVWVEPQFRRRGYATRVFHHLEEQAARVGADRIGLHVLTYRAKGRVPYPSLRERNVEQPPCRAAAK